MAVYLWILVHFIVAVCFLISGRSLYYVFYPLVLVISISVYLLKPISYDLAFYLAYFLNPEPFYEPLFYFISKLLSVFQNEYTSFVLIIILSILTYYLALRILKISFLKFLSILPLYINSMFFLLGSQNAIRQFLSTTILILVLSFLIKARLKLMYVRNLLLFFIIGILASLFHWSSLFFLLVVFVIFISLETIKIKIFHIRIVYLTNLMLGLIISYVIYYYYSEVVFVYLDTSIDWGEERTPNNIKAISILFYVYVTQYLLRKQNDYIIKYMLDFRKTYYFFTLPSAFVLGEGFSRMVFFLYAIDIFVISLIFSKRESLSLRERTAISISYIIYGISPNTLNILGTDL
ncbi:MAG: EpsG family protein [bacterium]